MPEKKIARLSLVLSIRERAILEELAEADGITITDVIRMLSRREYAARFGRNAKPAEETMAGVVVAPHLAEAPKPYRSPRKRAKK